MADIVETREFLLQNDSFFRTPLTDQTRFLQFFVANGKFDVLQDYSQQLMDLLRKHHQNPQENVKKSVIYAWRDGNFEPALEHPAICEFLMANCDHPAILLWNDNLKQERVKTSDPYKIEDLIQQLENTLIKAGFENPTLHLSFHAAFQELREDYIKGKIGLEELTLKSEKLKSEIETFKVNFSNRLEQLAGCGVDEAIAVIHQERADRAEQGMSTPKSLFTLLSNLNNLRLSFLSGETEVESLVGVKLSAEGETLRIWKGVEKRTQLMASSGFDLALDALRQKRAHLIKRGYIDEGNEVLRLVNFLSSKRGEYINSELPFHEFKNTCEQAIDKAMEGKLANHRGIKGVLQIILDRLSQFFTGTPFTLNTATKNKLQETQDALQKLREDSDDESLGRVSPNPLD